MVRAVDVFVLGIRKDISFTDIFICDATKALTYNFSQKAKLWQQQETPCAA